MIEKLKILRNLRYLALRIPLGDGAWLLELCTDMYIMSFLRERLSMCIRNHCVQNGKVLL